MIYDRFHNLIGLGDWDVHVAVYHITLISDNRYLVFGANYAYLYSDGIRLS
jgi:hypothetical protein